MVDLLELLLNLPRSMDEAFLQQCAVLAPSVLLENNGFWCLPKLYSCSRWVFSHHFGYVGIG